MSRLLLDTGIFIEVERASGVLDAVVADEDDVAIAAITAAELLEGVESATATHRAAREAFVEHVLAGVPIENYGIDVARAHARLLAYTRKTGVPRGAHDLMIAATAIVTDREVVTCDDKADFGALPGVVCRLVRRA